MVTEKMIEAFVKASSVATGDTMDCVRAGLEAALSTDAEPVDVEQIVRIRSHVKAHEKKERATFSIAGVKALLDRIDAAPPAPSVAVKPLRWKGPDSMGEYHSLDGLWGYIIRAGHKDGFWLTEVGDYFPSPDEAKAAAQAHYEDRVRSALSAQVQDVADLDARMKAAGMYTVAEMMGVTPLTKWKSNPAINTIEAFSEWLDRKVAEYLTMKAGYDLGDESEDDDLYEWVLAHAGVFSTIRDQFQVVTAAPAAKQEGIDRSKLRPIFDDAEGRN